MINENEKDFFNQSSIISRLGSGSASRSIYGPVAVWGKTKYFENHMKIKLEIKTEKYENYEK